MSELGFPELIEAIQATANTYHKLTIIAGQPGSGKTRVLNQVANQLGVPLVNLGLLLSERLLLAFEPGIEPDMRHRSTGTRL